MNPDFRDMLSALSAESVDYLIVGAYALAFHGIPRATGDMDVWIRVSPSNSERVWRSLVRFGAPLGDLSREDFEVVDQVIQVGIAPRRIDFLTSIDAVDFDQAWQDRMLLVMENVTVNVLSRHHLIQNKRAVGRPQDLADAARLESL